MKPTRRLILRRLAKSYGSIFSFSGVPMLLSGGIVLALAFSVASEYGAELGAIPTGLIAAFGVAYCVPWGIFTSPVTREETPFL